MERETVDTVGYHLQLLLVPPKAFSFKLLETIMFKGLLEAKSVDFHLPEASSLQKARTVIQNLTILANAF